MAKIDPIKVEINVETGDSTGNGVGNLAYDPIYLDNFQGPNDTIECFQNHMGLWMVEPRWFTSQVTAIKLGLVKPEARHGSEDRHLFGMIADGLAVVPIVGPMMKVAGKNGGASTIAARRGIRAAVNDKDVESILLRIDSPGGHVAGTAELAEDVKAANAIKPVFTFIEDLGASAAFWVASQSSQIFANRMAEVGSIGTVAVIHDVSKKAAMEGIEVHVVSTGAFKGMFTPGAEVTDDQIADLQTRIDNLNVHFRAAVMEGRSMDEKQLDKVATGQVFIAAEAQKLGLIDGVRTLDALVEEITDTFPKDDTNNANINRRRAQAKINLEKNKNLD